MMNWKKTIIFVSLLAAFLIISCDVGEEDQQFDSELQGTWVSNDASVYSGTVEISKDQIIITGFDEIQTPSGGNDNNRPFKGFAKGIALDGYSEDGKIFIEDGGKIQDGIPYTLNSSGNIINFTFGTRVEKMEKQ